MSDIESHLSGHHTAKTPAILLAVANLVNIFSRHTTGKSTLAKLHPSEAKGLENLLTP
jgi:hypothetical protein